MKFISRVFGTWMIALAVILLVVDGTKSLAANAPVFTSIAGLWSGLSPESWSAVEDVIATELAPLSADGLAESALAMPAWGFALVIGLLALFVGRKRRKPVFADPI